MPHNFGPCEKCGCLATYLMQVTNLRTGEKDWRVCCLLSPGHHFRLATDEDRMLEEKSNVG